MLAWLRQSSRIERRAFGACLAGWSLDALDVQLFSLVIPALIASWQVSKTEAGLIASVTLFASALGGWLGGALADRIGRVWALQVTILWFAIATFVSAFTQSFEQLMAVKALQGLGFGAEWAAGAVLMSETINPANRGKALGAVQSGWAIGWGAAVLLYTAVFSLFPSEVAWRVLFALGLLPALLVFYVRKRVPEPPRTTATVRTASFARSLVGIFARAATLRSAWSGFCSGWARTAVTTACSPGCRLF
jgi:MFS family permease